ncbi:mycofactocin system FadH/OYE family oxidoreductase 1 [Rhodococcus sp. X156]|uniref:mycofactocin system FadH/OYE family oxidoreductase 1 n=1 Tax=Rhodococcus sp. X156 TaxID=2499145 RepID=UPI000FD9A071|nr:mycofactocin system FadH/OYE family oxidoreductase 1 [Rhodococcus sp. X156]
MAGLLLRPVTLAGRTASSRVLFGPHETNLGAGRAFSPAHVAHYARRAAGGAGVVVTETASVHPGDWPYERAPLAAECGPGWADVVAACRPHGTLVLAGLGHAGVQGCSAHSQTVLWAPSRVADVVSRELPMAMEQAELDAVVAGFRAAAALAVQSDVDGVEVDAGAISLLRQAHSGLTNLRDDAYGDDRLLLTRQVLAAVRDELGPGRVLSLRLSCDELAPWGGITPEEALDQVAELSPLVDLLVVVRGGPYSVDAYRPDRHTAPGFNRELCAAVRVVSVAPVVLQGSVVDPATAEAALAGGVCDAVEMTRALIADAELVATLRAGGAPRPCVLCNQECRVRDPRNPVVSCVGDPVAAPLSGVQVPRRPFSDPTRATRARNAVVVGGGPAGLEAARVLADGGVQVRLLERAPQLGGLARVAVGFAPLVDWLEQQCRRLGVELVTGCEVGPGELVGAAVVLATGSVPAPRGVAGDAPWFTAAEVLAGAPVSGPVLVHDPVGGPVGVAVAEHLAAAGRPVAVVTADPVVGAQLGRTGDLAAANTRLQQAGVRRELSTLLRSAGGGVAVLENRYTGQRREVACAAVVDCGHRLPDHTLDVPGAVRVGDCVAPRTVAEAVREGRRAAQAVVAA